MERLHAPPPWIQKRGGGEEFPYKQIVGLIECFLKEPPVKGTGTASSKKSGRGEGMEDWRGGKRKYQTSDNP